MKKIYVFLTFQCALLYCAIVKAQEDTASTVASDTELKEKEKQIENEDNKLNENNGENPKLKENEDQKSIDNEEHKEADTGEHATDLNHKENEENKAGEKNEIKKGKNENKTSKENEEHKANEKDEQKHTGNEGEANNVRKENDKHSAEVEEKDDKNILKTLSGMTDKKPKSTEFEKEDTDQEEKSKPSKPSQIEKEEAEQDDKPINFQFPSDSPTVVEDGLDKMVKQHKSNISDADLEKKLAGESAHLDHNQEHEKPDIQFPLNVPPIVDDMEKLKAAQSTPKVWSEIEPEQDDTNTQIRSYMDNNAEHEKPNFQFPVGNSNIETGFDKYVKSVTPGISDSDLEKKLAGDGRHLDHNSENETPNFSFPTENKASDKQNGNMRIQTKTDLKENKNNSNLGPVKKKLETGFMSEDSDEDRENVKKIKEPTVKKEKEQKVSNINAEVTEEMPIIRESEESTTPDKQEEGKVKNQQKQEKDFGGKPQEIGKKSKVESEDSAKIPSKDKKLVKENKKIPDKTENEIKKPKEHKADDLQGTNTGAIKNKGANQIVAPKKAVDVSSDKKIKSNEGSENKTKDNTKQVGNSTENNPKTNPMDKLVKSSGLTNEKPQSEDKKIKSIPNSFSKQDMPKTEEALLAHAAKFEKGITPESTPLYNKLPTFPGEATQAVTVNKTEDDGTNINTTLVFAEIVFRHGDRYKGLDIDETFPNDPYAVEDPFWKPYGCGQIRNKGKMRSYWLGLFLRKRYNGFLRDEYYHHDVKFTSADLDRCIDSASVLTSGLYPPKGINFWNDNVGRYYQPIPIRTLHVDDDIYLAEDFLCLPYEQELDRIMLENMTNFNTKYKYVYEYLEMYTGRPVQTLEDVAEVYTTLRIVNENGKKLPEWTTPVFPNMLRMLNSYYNQILTSTDFFKKIKAGPLLTLLMDEIKLKMKNRMKPNYKIKFWAGFDTTILKLLYTIRETQPSLEKAEDLLETDYNGALIIELHQIKKKYFIKVLYFNMDANLVKTKAPRVIKICDGLTLCPVEEFFKRLEKFRIYPEEWFKICNMTYCSTASYVTNKYSQLKKE